VISKIVLLNDCEWPNNGKTCNEPGEIKRMKENIKRQVNLFLRNEFSWRGPPFNLGIARGPQRTLHLMLPLRYVEALCGKHEAGREGDELRERTGCKIQ
jgi:hypothetical protein